MKKMKYLILGHGRHGKDEVAYHLAKKLGLKFVSSSEFACQKVVYPKLKDKYSNWRQCFNDRHRHRALWFNLIDEYNTPDRSKLARELLEEYDIYVGMRNLPEYLVCTKQKLFDYVIWVDASDRMPTEPATSFTIPYDPDSMYLLDNNGKLEWLDKKINEFIKVSGIRPKLLLPDVPDTIILSASIFFALAVVAFAGLYIHFS